MKFDLILIFLILLLLKLTGIISWSWWIISLPLYGIPVCIALTIGLICFIILFEIFVKTI